MKKQLRFRSPNLRPYLLFLFLSFLTTHLSIAQTDCGSIESFEFSNDHESVAITNNGIYNLSELPESFYVKALTHGHIGSVRYKVTNLVTNQVFEIFENIVPYTFPSGNTPWNLGTGVFRIKATVFIYNNGNGQQCDVDLVTFTINDSEACLAEAGTLTATATSVCSTGEVTISATANGDALVPADYSVLYVLTKGSGLVIEQVNATPDFTVVGGGDYTIHTLVYPNGLDLGIVELGVTTGFDVNSLLIQGGGELCASLDVAGAPVHITNPDAGTLTATADTVTLSAGEAMLSATPNGDANQPEGYSTLFVLTQGEGLVIVNVGSTPDFTVTEAGNYTIHTLVYPTGLDLSVVELGVTTGFDVNGLLVQGGGQLCAALDVAGAPIIVEVGVDECIVDAGTVYSYHPIQCLNGGEATIYAEESQAPIIPIGYEQVFVLTNAFNLTILDVSVVPQFDINHVGFYRIHSLVYNPDTLDLSIVNFGSTTAFDLLPLLEQGGGDICASLDVHGAVNLVLPEWFCSFFNNYFGFGRNSEVNAVNDWVNTYDDYQSFEDAMLAEFTQTSVYPNPVKTTLNIKTFLLQYEIVSYTIVDMQGRLLKRGVISSLSDDRHQIDMSNLSIGTYIVQLNSEFRNFTTKVQVN